MDNTAVVWKEKINVLIKDCWSAYPERIIGIGKPQKCVTGKTPEEHQLNCWDLLWFITEEWRGFVLVLSETELIFFPVAGTVLWFGFRVRIMLIPHWCFGCCWAELTIGQGLFSFSWLPCRVFFSQVFPFQNREFRMPSTAEEDTWGKLNLRSKKREAERSRKYF